MPSMPNEVIILIIGVVVAAASWRIARTRGPWRLPAKELLHRVQDLRKQNAQWPQIEQALGRSEMLASIRGPHLFAPHTALNVIEHGCRIAMRKDPQADARAALWAAKTSMEKVTRYGD